MLAGTAMRGTARVFAPRCIETGDGCADATKLSYIAHHAPFKVSKLHVLSPFLEHPNTKQTVQPMPEMSEIEESE